jgi:ABC-type nitrate/sulfonate/bicarbonate transport system permease component
MWAFGEGMEVMFMVVVLYLTWPIVFNIVGGVAASLTPARASNGTDDAPAITPE